MKISRTAIEIWLELNRIIDSHVHVCSKGSNIDVLDISEFENSMTESMYQEFVFYASNSGDEQLVKFVKNDTAADLIKNVLVIKYIEGQFQILHLFSLRRTIQSINENIFNNNEVFWVGAKISKTNNIIVGFNCVEGTIDITCDKDITDNVKTWLYSIFDDVCHFVTDLTNLHSYDQFTVIEDCLQRINTTGE